jgi:hypothetical protein
MPNPALSLTLDDFTEKNLRRREKDDDCPTIKIKIAKFDACIAAKQLVNDTCFGGQSGRYGNEIKNYKAGRNKCQQFFCDKRCK